MEVGQERFIGLRVFPDQSIRHCEMKKMRIEDLDVLRQKGRMLYTMRAQSQSLIVWSNDPDAICFPSDENVTSQTESE